MKAKEVEKCVFEVSLQAKSDAYEVRELLKEIFISLNVAPVQVVERVQRKISWLSVYLSSREKSDSFVKQIRGLKLKDIAVKCKALRQKDWQERWKENIRPFRLTNNFDVVPVWCKKAYRKNKRTPLYIDTTMAFGTGLHETTRFMARLIDEYRGQFDNFLDVGTGTGLLALIAYECGAGQVYALDIDKESIRVAKKNLQVNGYLLDNTRIGDFATCKLNKRFDFVAANLVTHDLIALRRKIVASVNPGKFLAISGISLNNLRKLQQKFRPLPLRCLRVVKGKEWAALLYQRTK